MKLITKIIKCFINTSQIVLLKEMILFFKSSPVIFSKIVLGE